jgi:hypothetical protein
MWRYRPKLGSVCTTLAWPMKIIAGLGLTTDHYARIAFVTRTHGGHYGSPLVTNVRVPTVLMQYLKG